MEYGPQCVVAVVVVVVYDVDGEEDGDASMLLQGALQGGREEIQGRREGPQEGGEGVAHTLQG